VQVNPCPRAFFTYKKPSYLEYLQLLERYRAEVMEAAREGQLRRHHQGSQEGPISEVAETKRKVESIMSDPDQAQAMKAAVREYHEQFNERVQLEVLNGRDLADASLNASGFELLDHRSKVHDWDDADQVRDVYYPEMQRLVKQHVGASHCFVNQHVLRNSNGSTDHGPFMEVHSDFTDRYKEAVIRSVSSGREETPTFGNLEMIQKHGISAEDLRKHRLVVVHAWRSVGEDPLRVCPLAVCDGRTVGEEQLIRETVSGLERFRLMHDPGNRWYWFPDMTRHEVLLFKGFDSECKRYAFHSAFKHPDTPREPKPRFSIEMRVMCLLPMSAPGAEMGAQRL